MGGAEERISSSFPPELCCQMPKGYRLVRVLKLHVICVHFRKMECSYIVHKEGKLAHTKFNLQVPITNIGFVLGWRSHSQLGVQGGLVDCDLVTFYHFLNCML